MTDKENIVVLSDDDGNEIECEYLDTVKYKDKDYIVLYPLDQAADEGEVIFLELVQSADGTEDYLPVEDEKLLDEVFEEYMRIMDLEE